MTIAQAGTSSLAQGSAQPDVLQLGVPEAPRSPGAPSAKSTTDFGIPNSLVLILEPDRLYSESAFGRRVAADIQARSAVLTAENRRIEAELRAEEKNLADRREFTDPQVFRTLAEAFDEKVQTTRTTQTNKLREITLSDEDARQEFTEISRPILEQIMREVGAAVILEKGSVLLSASSIDVTDLAIARINAIFGEGQGPGSAEE